jgi:hypothetical protein
VAAAEELTPTEVVPRTVDTDLDHVAGELVDRRPELLELSRVADAPTVGLLEPVAVDVGDVADVAAAAHRTSVPGGLPDVTSGAEQIGMGIAHVVLLDRAASQVTQDGPAGQRVVDVTRHAGILRAGGGLRAPRARAPGGVLDESAVSVHTRLHRYIDSIYRPDVHPATIVLPMTIVHR